MTIRLPSVVCLYTPEEIYSLVKSIFAPSLHSAEELEEIIRTLIARVYKDGSSMYPPKSIIHYFQIFSSNINMSERMERWRNAFLIMLLAKNKGLSQDVWTKFVSPRSQAPQ